jgi:hypothetical protein
LLPRQPDRPKENALNYKSLALSPTALGGMLAAVLPTAAQDKGIAIDGSSTVFPAVEAIAEERFKTGQVGTGFAGVPQVGLPIAEILKKKPVL